MLVVYRASNRGQSRELRGIAPNGPDRSSRPPIFPVRAAGPAAGPDAAPRQRLYAAGRHQAGQLRRHARHVGGARAEWRGAGARRQPGQAVREERPLLVHRRHRPCT